MTIGLLPRCFAMLRGHQTSDMTLFDLPILPLDTRVPKYALERRGAISFGSPTSPKLSDGPCKPRLSRRGGVSVDCDDVEAKYLRTLGDVIPCKQNITTLTEFTTRVSLKDLGDMQEMNDANLCPPSRFKRKMSSPTVCSYRINEGIDRSQLNRISYWDFDTLSIARITKGRCLFYVGCHLLIKHDLFEEFHLDIMSVLKFLNLLEQHYDAENPFHNAVHAADVVQAMHCLLVNLKSINSFTAAELLACMLAAMAHDVNHPGVNTPHLIKTSSYLTQLHDMSKSASLLEQHHAKVAKSLIKESGIISNLDPKLQAEIYELVEDLIMATDMAQHSTYVNKMKNLMAEGFDPERADHRKCVMQLAIKCSDLCNTARPWTTCVQWGKLVLEEFWRQGDKEKMLMFDVANIFDRESCVPSKALTGFIDFIAEPLFTLWAEFCDTSFTRNICQQVDNNRSMWEDVNTLPDKFLLSS